MHSWYAKWVKNINEYHYFGLDEWLPTIMHPMPVLLVKMAYWHNLNNLTPYTYLKLGTFQFSTVEPSLVSRLSYQEPGYEAKWNLSNTDTLGTKAIVLISEVSLFQGENNIKLGLSQVSWLTRCPYFRCALRGVPLYSQSLVPCDRMADMGAVLWSTPSLLSPHTRFPLPVDMRKMDLAEEFRRARDSTYLHLGLGSCLYDTGSSCYSMCDSSLVPTA